MLAGAFDQSLGRQIVALTLTNVFLLWTLLVSGHLILDYSEMRGSAEPTTYREGWRRIWTGLCVAAVIPAVLTAYYYSGDQVKPWPFVLFAIFGALLAAIILTFVHLARRLIVPPGHVKFKEAFPLLLPEHLLDKAEQSPGLRIAGNALLNVLAQIPDELTRGYLAAAPDPSGRRRLLPGHGLAIAVGLTFFAVYLLIGSLHWGTAIVYVILLLTVLCWILAAFAFFLDRFRVPVLLVLAVFFIAAAQSPRSDHYFNLSATPPGYYGPSSTEYILAERRGAPNCPIIVVSANGGGIQSAAWTARVLSGLAEEFQKLGGPNLEKFLRSIRLISGVSGGSVGAMFFVNEIQPPGSTTPMSFSNVVQEAEESGLAEVVWGMAYPDLGHAFLPWFRRDLLLDRGHVLEETWVKSARDHGSPSLAKGLLEWNRGVVEGWRPATIFNATFVESGERLQISTIPVGDKGWPIGRKEFFYLYNADIRVATAARLSATYPYVSPAARPRLYSQGSPLFPDRPPDYEHLHAVDGGYFDNSGLCALTEWLNEALTQREDVWNKTGRKPTGREKILVLQIRGFPEVTASRHKPARGWFYQLYAPLSTMLGVWTTGQQATNVTELDLLQKYWAEKGIDLVPVIFQPDASVYQGRKGVLPLSWHLRKDDKDLIEKAWENSDSQRNCKTVVDFVGPP